MWIKILFQGSSKLTPEKETLKLRLKWSMTYKHLFLKQSQWVGIYSLPEISYKKIELVKIITKLK